MDKLKNLVSHRKSEDTTAETNRGSEEFKVLGVHKEGEHPIYDQMASPTRSSGEPSKTTENAPHFSNTPVVKQTAPGASTGPSATQTATPSLHPDMNQHRPGSGNEQQRSTASIKSGVIGFSQGSQDPHPVLGNNHPAKQNLEGNQVVGAGAQPSSAYQKENEGSHLGNTTAGSGVIGTGAVAGNKINHKPEDSVNTTRSGEQQPFKQSIGQSPANNGTGRSFPLAGGVTDNRLTEKAATSAREPGTKEKEVGLHDGQGREGLAGSAAAATASSALPGHRHETAKDTQTTDTNNSETWRGPHPDALAAATTAASNTQSVSPLGQGQQETASTSTSAAENNPTAPNQPGSGLLFTKSPHPTDTANVFDPHLHIPGEFPSPTPIEEQSEPSYISSKGSVPITSGGQHELRHTGTLDEPRTKSADHTNISTNDHHYGRDAAIAGGLGAAGAGAYAAGKHREEPQQTGSEILPEEKSPYSSHKIDPRVDTKPSGFSQQRFDASTTDKPQARDPTLTDDASHSTSQPAKDEKSQHQGRDAALLGAAGVTTAGLYASQRANEPDSGPASSTIGPHKSNAANVLDPRVQPDPNLQKHHQAASTIDDPAPKTVGPHKSDIANVMDPRVLPDPEKQKAAPKELKEGNSGRDTAIAGGVGAGAGYGAYEAAKVYDSHRGTQPAASMNDQRYDPTVKGAHQPAPSATHGQGVRDGHDLEKSGHHYGRDAAVVGGLGAVGAGAYAASRGDEQQAPVSGHQYGTTGTREVLGSEHQYPTCTQQVPGSQQQYSSSGSHQPSVGQQHAPTATGVQKVPGSQQQYPSTGSHQPSVGQQQLFPTSAAQQGPFSQTPQQSQHHYGRDAAAAGGLGAGAYAATRGNESGQAHQPYTSQQQYSPIGSQQPSVGQQQYPPIGSQQHSPGRQQHLPIQASQQTPMLQDPQQSQHHYGRDAAVVGGLGAAGAGAYAASRGHEHGHAQQPPLSQQYPSSRTQPSVGQHQYPPTGIPQQHPPTQTSQPQQQPQHHYSRDAGVVGGLGAAGAGTYAGTRGHDHNQPQHPTQGPNQQPPLSAAQRSSAGPSHQRIDSAQDPKTAPSTQYQKRDAAALGATGAYAYSHHEREAAQKAHEQQLKEQQKAFDKQQKEQQKAYETQQKNIERSHVKEQKQHDKLAAAEGKKHEKKLERERERERDHEEEPKEKKHHLFGFLHRDKDKKNGSAESSPRASGENVRHSREYGTAAGMGASTTSTESERERDGRHKLHKEPPKGHPAREDMERERQQQQQQQQQYGQTTGAGMGPYEQSSRD
ncbi:hypothetical protein CC80DRAFT_495582 [Byssothecium circinans]|uniref:Uncharacterized protein n=1 Tax=Byssothecium circinans TaxID=147558 RepID=A0A6A5THL5_9PLEO|nr:hypothetical protein CC80DRAFT_495582 [Byssothecium circinans]